MIDFLQINLRKAFIAAVELNKQVSELKEYVVLASETYNFKGRVRSLPRMSQSISHPNPRAAIICSRDLNIIKIEKLTTRDCAVGLLQRGGKKVLIASIYLDIKMSVVQDWLVSLVNFARKKKYSLLIGMDSNSHSVLYGHESNNRGEDLEGFIVGNGMKVENIGLRPTFETFRSGLHISSIIDVTLTLGMRDPIENWRVEEGFNGSDHNTIRFNVNMSKSKLKEKTRCWNSANWAVFQDRLKESKFFFPEVINEKKLDKMVSSLYLSLIHI